MRMHWLLRRISTSITVILAALVINFVIPRLMPGTPVDFFAGGSKLSAEVQQAIIRRFGLDKPMLDQFWHYIANSIRGDFGYSFYFYPEPVWDLIKNALPWTVFINVTALVIQIIIGYFLGVTTAWKAGRKTDSILQTMALALQSMPLFWLAMLVIYGLSFMTGWFPMSGAYTPAADFTNIFQRLYDILSHAFLPILTLVIGQFGVFQLIMRNTMVNVLKEQYMMVAKAKGLSERRIKHRHAARNALLPMTTFIGLSFAASITGSVFIETVFAYPGIGKLVYESAFSRDYPVLQGCFLIFSVFIVLVNFVVDIVYKYIDPRIKY